MLFTALSASAQSLVNSITGINGPTFVAIDANRTIGGVTSSWLYVSEHGNIDNTGGGRILRYNLADLAAGGTDIGGGNFVSPDGILIDSSGNLYIADRAQDRVVHLSNTGTVLGTFGSATAGAADEMHGPVQLAFDGSGNIYVAEHGETLAGPGNGGQFVSKYTTAGVQQWRVGGNTTSAETGKFASTGPYGVAVIGGSVYVSDGFDSRVQVFNAADGSYVSQFSIPGTLPLGLTVDSSGNLWVAESSNNGSGPIQQVEKMSTAGVSTGVALTGGLSLPFNVAIDSATNMAYVGDYGNGRVAVFDLSASSSGGGSGGGSTTPPVASIAPKITAFDIDLATATLTHARFLVTFDKAVTGVDASDFSVHTQGSATATITGASAIDASHYAVDFDYSGSDGSIQLAIKTSGTGIADASSSANAFVGNGITASGAVTVNNTPPADNTIPVVSSFTAGAATGNAFNFTLTFSEPVTGVGASDFVASSSSGVTATVGAVTGSGTTYTVPVTLSAAGQVQLTVVGGATANITDAAGNWFGGNGSADSSIGDTGGGSGGGGVSAPVITSGTSASATAGTAFSYTITASNSPTSFAATGLAGTGLSLNASTGVISGTPTAAGTITSNLTASNAGGTSAAVTLTINVAAASGGGGGGVSAPVITSGTSASATAGTAFSYTITASNSPTSFAATGLAGTGLSLNATTGVISGTPTAAGTITSNLTASNAGGTSAAVTLTINVAAASGGGGGGVSAPVITSGTSASATAGTAFSYTITASNSPTSFAATGLAGTGLSLNASTGVISGTPTAAGTITSNLTASNAGGTSAAVTLTINVAAASGGGGTGGGGSTPGAPVVTSADLSYAAGVAFTYQVTATNSPTSYSLTGAPSGVFITNSGALDGLLFAPGTYTFTVNAKNASGTGSATVNLTIVSNPGGGNGGGNGGSGKKSQTVVIVTPVSNTFVGVPIELQGSSTSGLPITYSVITGDATVNGSTLTINSAGTVVVRGVQNGDSTWASASGDASFTAIRQVQVPDTSRVPHAVHTDGTVTLDATTSSGLPLTYTVVSGPATVDGNTLTFTGSGTVTVRASSAGNSKFEPVDTTFTIDGNPVPRLINLSSRLRVTAGDANGASIVGFAITGDAAKQILIRAVGPALANFGISSPLASPTLKVYDHTGTVVATNSGWNDDAQIAATGKSLNAFPLPAGSKDAAVLVTLEPGTYTAQVTSATGSGTVLVEVYDATANAAVPTKQLINLSTRGTVGSGDDVLVGGFAVSGNESKKVLIRAVGPALGAFGVPGTLSDPMLTVYKDGKIVAQNDSWGTGMTVSGQTDTPATAAEITAANAATGAFPLGSGSADAAVILTLQPGVYSAVVTGANGTSGAAMVEIYEIPNP